MRFSMNHRNRELDVLTRDKVVCAECLADFAAVADMPGLEDFTTTVRVLCRDNHWHKVRAVWR
jgi:hypothetical protein